MKPRREGRIVVTTSIAGLRSESHSGYACVASKAATNNLVRQAAIELAPHDVGVNAIAPGPFATNINGDLRLPESAERMRTHVLWAVWPSATRSRGRPCCWPRLLPAT